MNFHRDDVLKAADASVRLHTFAAVVALLEGGMLPGGNKTANATALHIIALCKAEQQRQLKRLDKATKRELSLKGKA